jgi:hypothetical protein
MKLLTLLEAFAKFAEASHHMHVAGPLIVEEACRMVAREAKRVLGTYDYGRKKLKLSTVSRKGKDTPGVNTGEMRDSIQWTAKGLEGQVGSNSQKAVWFELGTKNQPPRSFLVGAVRSKGRSIRKMAGQTVVQTIAAHGPGLHDVIHIAKKLGHKAKELVTT